MQMFRISRSAPVRRSAARLAGVATAGALAATLALAAPAQAADPAVAAEALTDTAYTFDAGCNVVSGADLNDGVLKTVVTNGTKKLNVVASGTEKVADTVDPTDTVTMKATNQVTGSITGAKGAFSKAAFTMRQGGSIAMAQGFSTDCDPEVELQAGFATAFTVKKAGSLSIKIDMPRDTLAQLQMTRDGVPEIMTINYNGRGTYLLSRPAKPGSYVLQVQSAVTLGLGGGPQIQLSHSGAVGVTVGYSKS